MNTAVHVAQLVVVDNVGQAQGKLLVGCFKYMTHGPKFGTLSQVCVWLLPDGGWLIKRADFCISSVWWSREIDCRPGTELFKPRWGCRQVGCNAGR
jgi:hypothetical protein